jgi:hypothetical protein
VHTGFGPVGHAGTGFRLDEADPIRIAPAVVAEVKVTGEERLPVFVVRVNRGKH